MKRYTLSLWLFNLYIRYIIQYAGLDKSQAGIKISGRSINIHRYEDDTTLIAESKEKLNDLKLGKEQDKVYIVTLVTELLCWKDHSISWTA